VKKSVLLIALLSLARLGSATVFMDEFATDNAGWTNGAGPVTHVNTGGGAGGASDNYISCTSDGTAGAGGKMVMNNAAQWKFNYTAAGLTAIQFYAKTSYAPNGLTIRAGVDGTGGKFVSTTGAFLPNDGAWHQLTIALTASDVTAAGGTNTALTLANPSQLRLLSNPAVAFSGSQIAATISYDRIRYLNNLATNTPTVTPTPVVPAATLTPDARPLYLYLGIKNSNVLQKVDPRTGKLLARMPLRVDIANEVNGVMGLAYSPLTGRYFVLMAMSDGPYDGSDRAVGEVNMSTGLVHFLGFTYDYATSLAVDGSGQLWSVTGEENSDHARFLMKIGMDGVTTMVTMGADERDHGLAYNWDDNSLYEASGDNADSLDRFSLASVNPARVHLNDFSGFSNDKAEALAYAGGNQFYIGMGDNVYLMSSTGGVRQAPVYTQTADYIRGIAASHDDFWGQSIPVGKYLYDVEQGAVNTLRKVDPQTGETLRVVPLALTGTATQTLYNIVGMDLKPGTAQVYVVFQQSSHDTSRTLGTLDLATGTIHPISGTGAAISSIAFDAAGNLFGSVGYLGGAGYTSNDIVRINLADGSLTKIVDASLQSAEFRNYDTAFAYNTGDGALYLSTYYHGNLYRIFASPTAVVTPVVETGISGTWGPATTSLGGGWMLTMSNYVLGFFSQSGEVQASAVTLDHYPKAMFLAGNLTLPTLTPTITATPTSTGSVTASDTPTPTKTPTAGYSYSLAAGKRVYAASKGKEILELNPATGDLRVLGVVGTNAHSVTGLLGMAKDPSNGQYFFVNGDSGFRQLFTVNMQSGQATYVADLNDYVNSLAFDAAGNLYGTIGDNGTLRHDVVSISKTTGTITQVLDITDNVDGNGLVFRPADGFLYNFESQGGGALNVMRKVSLDGATDLTVSASSPNMTSKTMSSAALPDGNLLVTDGSDFDVFTPAGTLVGRLYSSSDYGYLRGMVVADAIAGFATQPLSTPTPVPVRDQALIGASRNSMELYFLNPDSGEVKTTVYCTGLSFYGFTGLAWNPVEERLYGVAQITSGNSNRHLVSIALPSGAVTDIATIGAYVAGIAFTDQGTLYGVLGNGAGDIVPINTGTGAVGASVINPGGTSGLSLAYDAGLGRLFKLNGSNWSAVNSIDLAGPTAANVAFQTPASNAELRAATSWATGEVIVALSNDTLIRLDTVSGETTFLGTLGPDLKGLATVPLALLPPTPVPSPTPTGQSLLVVQNFGSGLKVLDLGSMAITQTYPVTLPNDTVVGFTGLARDPNTGLVFMLANMGGGGRHLLSFDLATGATTDLGNAGFFSGLAFNAAGTLFAVAGNNMGNTGQVFTMDTATAAVTQISTYSNGSAGLTLASDPNNSLLYVIKGSTSSRAQRYDSAGNSIGAYLPITLPDPSADTVEFAMYEQAGKLLVAYGQDLYRVDDSTGTPEFAGRLPLKLKGGVFINAPLATPTVQPTSTATQVLTFTPTPTQTPGFGHSGENRSIIGPVPAKRDQPLCLYFPAQPQSSQWTVFNSAGEKVASLNFGAESSQCWSHPTIAPGVYFVQLEVVTANGKETRTQKVAIVP
jgi:hypothetical protein